MMEVVDAGVDAAICHHHTIDDGWIIPSDIPGLGITFDEAKLHELAIE